MNRKDHGYGREFVLCSVLLLAFGLSACSFGNSSGGAATPTATPQPTPSPTSSLTQSGALTTYKGDGFTIGYPASWMANAGANGAGVAFSNPAQMTEFLIEILPNPDGVAAPAGVVQRGLSTALQTVGGKNAKTVAIAPTVTVGGETWNQGAVTGTQAPNGQTPTLKLVMMATNHPANSQSTRLFIITYVAPAQTFNQISTTAFQPMLQSFKFTS